MSYLRKKLFGTSSEKRPDIDPNQLSLFDVQEGMEIPAADMEEAEETVVRGYIRQRKKKPALEEQFAGAAVNRVVVDSLTEEEKKCPVCGAEMISIGTEFIPAKYEVTEYAAATYECPRCKQIEEPLFIKDEGCPPALIEKSYAAPLLAADILKNKVCPGPAVLPSGAGTKTIQHTDYQGIHGRLDHPCVPDVFPAGRAVLP